MGYIAKGSITLSNVNDAYTVLLSKSSCVIKADFDGSNPQLNDAQTVITVCRGDKAIAFDCVLKDTSYASVTQVTGRTKYALKITNLPANVLEGSISATIATDDGFITDIQFGYSVIKESTMLDWIKDWEGGKTKIGNTYVMTPKIFIGQKDQYADYSSDGTNPKQDIMAVPGLTGVYIGPDSDSTGIYGYKDSAEIFHLNSEGGSVGCWNIDQDSIWSGAKNNTANAFAVSGITIGSTGVRSTKWRLESDGSGALAGSNIVWDTNGNLTLSNSVKISWGGAGTTSIQGFKDSLVTSINDAEGRCNSKIEQTAENITATVSTTRSRIYSNLFGFCKNITFESEGIMLPYIQAYGIYLTGSKLYCINNLGLNGEGGDFVLRCRMYCDYAPYVSFYLCGHNPSHYPQPTAGGWATLEVTFTNVTCGGSGFLYIIPEDGSAQMTIADLCIERGTVASSCRTLCAEDAQAYGKNYRNIEWDALHPTQKQTETVNGGSVDAYYGYVDSTADGVYEDILYKDDVIAAGDSKVYTLSFWAKGEVDGMCITSYLYGNGNNPSGGASYEKSLPGGGSQTVRNVADGATNTYVTTKWKKYYIHWRTINSSNFNVIPFRIVGNLNADHSGGRIFMAGAVFEEGYVCDDNYASASSYSKIQQTADSITLSIAKVDDKVGKCESRITATEKDISLKVSVDDAKGYADSALADAKTYTDNKDSATRTALSDTGIDITARTVEVTADNFTVKNNSEEEVLHSDANGNLVVRGTVYASAGTFAGTVTARGGSIGGWNINSDSLVSKNGLMWITDLGEIYAENSEDDYVWRLRESGEAEFALGNVRFHSNGDAEFKGQITSTSGEIGCWHIDQDAIWSGDENNESAAFTTSGITIGSTGIRSTKWRLESDGSGALANDNISWNTDGNLAVNGAVTATSGKIGCFNISNYEDGTGFSFYNLISAHEAHGTIPYNKTEINYNGIELITGAYYDDNGGYIKMGFQGHHFNNTPTWEQGVLNIDGSFSNGANYKQVGIVCNVVGQQEVVGLKVSASGGTNNHAISIVKGDVAGYRPMVEVIESEALVISDAQNYPSGTVFSCSKNIVVTLPKSVEWGTTYHFIRAGTIAAFNVQLKCSAPMYRHGKSALMYDTTFTSYNEWIDCIFIGNQWYIRCSGDNTIA